jgi:branched-subunit amino acid ABC-type transport system permease component
MSTYVIQVLSGIASGAVLFIVASGLTLIFGALRIVNFAHGSLYMVGAFVGVSVGNTIGVTNATFPLVLIGAAIATAVVGLVLEVTALRLIYREPLLVQLTVTFAFVLIIGSLVRSIYGPSPRLTETPPLLRGGIDILGQGYPIYQIFLIVLAMVVAGALWLIMYRTSLGRMIRAAVDDPELLRMTGINVRWLFTGVFVLGSLFAGLGGAANAPLGSISLGMDVDVILKAFVVVVIGGMGSLLGAFVAAMLVGVAESLGVLLVPEASLAMVFLVLVVVLAVRPSGMFGRAPA